MPSGISPLVRGVDQDELHWRRLLKHSRQARELKRDDVIELQHLWRIAVQSYTSCKLTKASDKLVAIASIAKIVSESTNERYVAGLWQYDDLSELVEQLAWRVKDSRQADGQPSKRQNTFRAPVSICYYF